MLFYLNLCGRVENSQCLLGVEKQVFKFLKVFLDKPKNCNCLSKDLISNTRMNVYRVSRWIEDTKILLQLVCCMRGI